MTPTCAARRSPRHWRTGASALLASALLGALSGCAWLGLASKPEVPMQVSEDQIKRQLIAQSNAWDRAIVRKDRTAIEANMAAHFFHIGGDGSTESREEFIQDLVDPQLVIHPYTVDDLSVQLYGDTALLSGSTRMTGTFRGKPFSNHYRYIDVYVRESARWKVVSVQITKIAPAP